MELKQNKLCRIFCLTGILNVIFYVLHDVIGAMNYPGYNWMAQAVSDLTSTDAPCFAIARGLSSVHAICSVVCCLFVLVLAQKENKLTKLGIALFTVMSVISAVGYSLFPISGAGYDGSTRSFIHVYILTALVVALSIVSLTLMGIGFIKGGRKTLGIIAFAALALMFIGAVGSGAAPKEVFGIFERFSTYSAVLFTAVLGVAYFADKGSSDTACQA